MSDLDKLMKKLKSDEPTPKAEETKPEPTPAPTPAPAPMETPAPAIDDDEDEPEKISEDKVDKVAEKVMSGEIKAGDEMSEENDTKMSEDPTPANADENHTPEAEVGLLQNNGIYRREMLLIKKEQVDVLKVIAQTLLDIKSKLMGEDGKKD